MGSAREARRIRPVVDGAIALVVGSLPFFDAYFHGVTAPAIATVVFSLVLAISLYGRRRFPVIALGVLLLAAIIAKLIDSTPTSLVIGAEIALFTVAIMNPRRLAIIAGLISAVTIFSIGQIGTAAPLLSEESLEGVAWAGLAVAVGDGMRTRRNYVRLQEERVIRAEETRHQLARMREAEERVHIARELHDIVAHHLAVINIQAGLAERAMSQNASETTVQAIERVSEAARSALDDLSAVLRLLRGSEDPEQREPAPGLSEVNNLIASFAHAGDGIHWTIKGKVRSLEAASELTAYRVIQESLTNASKYGVIGETHLTIAYEPSGLIVDVINPIREPAAANGNASAGTGYGVIGLHERVGSIGGTLTANARPDGSYRVYAFIPYASRSG